MEILKKLDELIDFSVDLETNLDESESIEEVLLCLEDIYELPEEPEVKKELVSEDDPDYWLDEDDDE